MSEDSQVPWSDDPNAPQIPYVLYESEKYNFAGIVLTAMFYGEPIHASVYPIPQIYHPRDCRPSVLPMHGRVAQSFQPQKGHLVGPRGAHYNHVLVRDHIHWDDPPHSIHFLHR